MSITEYRDALKQGQKEYRKSVIKGSYPYLSVLDDIISFTDIVAEMNVGLVDIPMELIVGTKTAGRTQSFAGNFMPLLAESSEFAAKWSSLSNMLQEEGLRDPIKAYEYLNYYYVEEGNKRVSVMKYLGAASIPGVVIRLMPKRTNTHENKLYYEFFKFNSLSKINYLNFSKLGSYRRLQLAVGKTTEEEWTDDDRMIFKSFYVRFEKAYRAKAGSELPVSVSDAILIYLNVYPYETAKDNMAADFKKNLEKIWEEFLVPQDDPIELSMVPEAKAKRNVITKLLTPDTKKKKLKIAFVHDKSGKTSGWTYGHELGRLHLEQKFGERIETVVYENVNPVNVKASEEVLEEVIGNGCDIVFTTTPKLLNASLKAAVKHPEVKILNCSLNATHPYIRTYYGRMYEAKFLIGAIAGAMSGSDSIGYIADYPIYGMTANINAFTMGVHMVNPRARVILEWSTVKDRDFLDNLKKNGVCYISDRDMIIPEKASRQFGLYYEDLSADPDMAVPENMATPVWHWGKFYELIIRSIMSGSWKDYEPTDKVKALNYWWGMSAGVIDVICSKKMPEGTKRLVELLKNNIANGEFNPFSGKLIDQNGIVRHESEDAMSPDEIIRMDWLVKGVEGYIPKPEELTDEAKQIVELQGVKKEAEDELGV